MEAIRIERDLHAESADHPDDLVRHAVAGNRHLSFDALQELIGDESWYVRVGLAGSKVLIVTMLQLRNASKPISAESVLYPMAAAAVFASHVMEDLRKAKPHKALCAKWALP